MHVKKHGIRGFTLVEIMTVVAIMAVLAAIAVPTFLHARGTSQANLCIDNLRLLDGGKQQWALEKGASPTTVPEGTDIQPYLGRGTGELPVCPLDSNATFETSYQLQNCQTSPTCQINPTSHVLP
jgi:prepilin-type N-terminal cleavage/methylation domain-containing protein